MNWSSFAQIFMLNMDPLMRSLICSRLEILTPYRKSCIFISQMIAMKFFRGRCVNTHLWVKTYWPASNVFWTNLERGCAFIFRISEKRYFPIIILLSLLAGQNMFFLWCSVCALSLWTLKKRYLTILLIGGFIVRIYYFNHDNSLLQVLRLIT